jgi:hypothetical protein
VISDSQIDPRLLKISALQASTSTGPQLPAVQHVSSPPPIAPTPTVTPPPPAEPTPILSIPIEFMSGSLAQPGTFNQTQGPLLDEPRAPDQAILQSPRPADPAPLDNPADPAPLDNDSDSSLTSVPDDGEQASDLEGKGPLEQNPPIPSNAGQRTRAKKRLREQEKGEGKSKAAKTQNGQTAAKQANLKKGKSNK